MSKFHGNDDNIDLCQVCFEWYPQTKITPPVPAQSRYFSNKDNPPGPSSVRSSSLTGTLTGRVFTTDKISSSSSRPPPSSPPPPPHLCGEWRRSFWNLVCLRTMYLLPPLQFLSPLLGFKFQWLSPHFSFFSFFLLMSLCPSRVLKDFPDPRPPLLPPCFDFPFNQLSTFLTLLLHLGDDTATSFPIRCNPDVAQKQTSCCSNKSCGMLEHYSQGSNLKRHLEIHSGEKSNPDVAQKQTSCCSNMGCGMS